MRRIVCAKLRICTNLDAVLGSTIRFTSDTIQILLTSAYLVFGEERRLGVFQSENLSNYNQFRLVVAVSPRATILPLHYRGP